MTEDPKDFQNAEHVKSEQLSEKEGLFFEPGEVVRLASGGPDMTVHSYQRIKRGAEGMRSEINTVWHDKTGALHHGHFAHASDQELGRLFAKD